MHFVLALRGPADVTMCCPSAAMRDKHALHMAIDWHACNWDADRNLGKVWASISNRGKQSANQRPPRSLDMIAKDRRLRHQNMRSLYHFTGFSMRARLHPIDAALQCDSPDCSNRFAPLCRAMFPAGGVIPRSIDSRPLPWRFAGEAATTFQKVNSRAAPRRPGQGTLV